MRGHLGMTPSTQYIYVFVLVNLEFIAFSCGLRLLNYFD